MMKEEKMDTDGVSKIVFTNGCFDILHAGHVSYLRAAKELGSRLCVGLNSDESIRLIKGPDRPINSQVHRLAVLSALRCVDHVELFDDPTPFELIKKIHPDVLVKGGDWSKSDVVGKDLVESWGGKVVIIPYLPTLSTTDIINRIRRIYACQ